MYCLYINYSSAFLKQIETNFVDKGKISPSTYDARRHEDVGGCEGIAPLFLDLGTRWRSNTVLDI
jgi:hypothetical protein